MIPEEKIYEAAHRAFRTGRSKFHWPRTGLFKQSDEFKLEFSLMCADINSVHLEQISEALYKLLEKKDQEMHRKQIVSESLIAEYKLRVYRWKLITVVGWLIAIAMLLIFSLLHI